MGFKKGNKINVGRCVSVETRLKLSIANTKPKIHKICVCGKEFKVWPSKKTRAKFCSKICCNKSKIGQQAWNKGLVGWRAGEKHNWMPKGEKHWSWKGGISKNVHSTSEPQYKEWRMSVFKRDNFKCKIENENCKGQLQAHHILRWAEYPELRYEINNGITLCLAHHPRKRAEEKRLEPIFRELVTVSKDLY